MATPEATPPPASSSAIGPSGGSSRSSDGELEVVVPAGALTAPTTFVIGPVPGGAPPLPDGRGPVTPVIDVTAYGPGKVPVTVFNRPLRLVFHYKAAQPQVIASWDGQEWVNMATSVDPGAHIATATAPHLTPLVAFSSATASLFFTVPVQVPVGGIVVIVIALLIVGGTTAVARLRLTPTAGPA